MTARVNVLVWWVGIVWLVELVEVVSLAAYLGELIRGELGGASSPSQRRTLREAGAGTRAPVARASSRSVRLSDQRLLTELPKPKPRPGEG